MDNTTIIEGEAVPVTHISLGTFFKIPAVRQIMLLIGVAGSVAIGFAVVLWSQTPEYSRLYGDLDSADAAQVAEALRTADIEFKLDTNTGSVLVLDSRLHDARLELASQGLPQGASFGMESLNEQPAFGQSQFRENAVYQHALESELARTIGHLGGVRDARVHLALPKQSAFIREHKPASASVMLSLNLGRDLQSDQAAAIVHLVASSVPNLLANNVTVIDQQGRLLSSGNQPWSDAMSGHQFKLAQRLERIYKQRIEDLLTPLLGPGRVRAEVVADMDFTVSEETRQRFDPDGGVLVSESVTHNQKSGGDAAAQGIPGALSNQPPEAGGSGAGGESQRSASATTNSAGSSTRNFEVDRTISHTRPQPGTIRRLSVAVLVDDTPADTGDEAVAQSLTPADIQRFESLIKEAVGFDEARGDTVAVVNAAFKPLPELVPQQPPKLWDRPIVVNSLKMILGAALVLAMLFGLIRPMLNTLLATNAEGNARVVAGGNAFVMANAGRLPQNSAALAGPSYDEKVAAAKNISGHDPAKVAQVVKKWVEAGDA